jgi:hypothetical protein
MQHTRDPALRDVVAPGGTEHARDAGSGAAGPAAHVEDHHFEHPTVAPVSPPAPVPDARW